MKFMAEHGFFILALLAGLIFTLAGFLYEMWQYKRKK